MRGRCRRRGRPASGRSASAAISPCCMSPCCAAQGVPARARCGFGAYFQQGQVRRPLGDRILEREAQALGAVRRAARCPSARALQDHRSIRSTCRATSSWWPAIAWQLCRAGKADPMDFGILDMFGWWMIAGNVMRDIAALNNREMLPWDVLGRRCRAPMTSSTSRLFDRLAALSHAPDAHFDELRDVYADDPGRAAAGHERRPQPSSKPSERRPPCKPTRPSRARNGSRPAARSSPRRRSC